MADAVNHPSHYTQGKIEVIDAIEGLGLEDDFLLGNVLKYIARWKSKGGVIDLEKGMWYLKRRIDNAKKEIQNAPSNPTGRTAVRKTDRHVARRGK